MIGKIIAVVLETALSADWEEARSSYDAVTILVERSPDCARRLIAQRLLVTGENRRHSRHLDFGLIALCRACWCRFCYGIYEGRTTMELQIVRVLTGCHFSVT